MCNNYLIRVMAVFSLMLVVNTISYADVVDITLCDIKADFDLEHDNIDIITHLELTKPETLKTFNLMLSSDVEIHTLKCIVNSQSYDISWDFIGNDTIHLIFPPDVPPKKDLMLEIEYTFSIEPYKEEVLVLGRGHRWYPHAFDDITTYQFLITVPKDYIVITSGDLIKNEKTSNQSQYKWRTNIPVFKLPIIITKPEFYSIINKEIDNNTISLYTFTADEEVREIIINEIQQSFVFYEGLIGEYHHKCLTFIEIPDFPTINISSGLVMFGPKYTDEYKEGRYGRFILPVVHQWYSAGLFFELFGKGFWFFQMSMPWYLRYMYIQETDGDSVFSEALHRTFSTIKKLKTLMMKLLSLMWILLILQ